MAFRDDREALRARAENAEEKLVEAEREIARLQSAAARPSTPPAAEAGEPPFQHPPQGRGRWARRLTVVAIMGTVLFGFVMYLNAGLDHSAQATWRAVVKGGGGGVEPGTPCTLQGRFRSNGTSRMAARAEVRCGAVVLHSGEREFGGMFEFGPRRCEIWEGQAEGGQQGVYHYRLQCADPGALDLDTSQGRLVVTDSRGHRIEMTVDTFSEPRRGDPLFDGNRPVPGRFVAFERRGKVETTSDPERMARGASCVLRVEPAFSQRYNCRLEVRCDERVLYGQKGNGFNRCAVEGGLPVRANDPKGTAAEGDPILRMDLPAKKVEVSDDLPGALGITIALDPPSAP